MRGPLYLFGYVSAVITLFLLADGWSETMYTEHRDQVLLHRQYTHTLPGGHGLWGLLVFGGALMTVIVAYQWRIPIWALASAMTVAGALANINAMATLGGVPDFIRHGTTVYSPGDLLIGGAMLLYMAGAVFARDHRSRRPPRSRRRRARARTRARYL